MTRILFLILFFSILSHAIVFNPIVDTDKSVNTYSVETIADDLIDNSMTDEQKLEALFRFHRRMTHHFRLKQETENSRVTFDIIKMYTVYGCAWCTQQACVFRTLCSEVFGWDNTEGLAGNGTLVTSGQSGGHSSFHLRFNNSDQWHWVDPIIGAYAKNKTNGNIAALDEIRSNPAILIDAVNEGRASMPYFPCNTGTNPIPDTLEAAYSYFDYDTGFVTDFADGYGRNQYTNLPSYFTTRKNLQQGEIYFWYWDFLEGDYFNLQERAFAVDSFGNLTRDWEWYPPRHLCGWKDSLDTKNWPYFKPYKKVINGDTCYRYYANGIHTFAPNLQTGESKDSPFLNSNIAFYADDNASPPIRPASVNMDAEIAYRIRIPYPIMSLKLQCDYVKTNPDDVLTLSMARIYFNHRAYRDSVPPRDYIYDYQDTLSADSFQTIKDFSENPNGHYETTLRKLVDPLHTDTTYYGYVLKFTMKASGNAADVGINGFKVECIFQHNMFALPQLEPGANQVTVTIDSGTLSRENLKLALSWMDNGIEQVNQVNILTTPHTYTINVGQAEMPRMIYMALANTVEEDIGIQTRPLITADHFSVLCYPNPLNRGAKIAISHWPLALSKIDINIFNINGKSVTKLKANSQKLKAGIIWNATDYPSGLYIIRLTSGSNTLTKRIMLIK
jgi:hypothetical protein